MNKIFSSLFFLIICVISGKSFSSTPFSEDYVSPAVRRLQTMSEDYKRSPTSTNRKDQNDFIRTGKNEERFKSLNYKRLATAAEKLIMMEAIISTNLTPYGPYNDVLKDYESFLSNLTRDKSHPRYVQDYKHNLKAYTVASLAIAETERDTKSFEELIGELAASITSKNIVDPSLTGDLGSYLSNLYQNSVFQNAFQNITGRKPRSVDDSYDPDLLAYKQVEATNRYRRTWMPLLSTSVLNPSLFSNQYRPFFFSSPLVRRNLKLEATHAASSPIYYDLISSKDVLDGITPAKGVIIDVYGGDEVEVGRLSFGIPSTFEELREEHIFAKEGYLYYRLYPRGTKAAGVGKGETHGGGEDYRQDETEGIFTLARDVAYFAAKLKYHDAQILGDYSSPSPPLGSDTETLIHGASCILGKRIPILLSGVSFGGALTLMTACNDEKITFLESDGNQKTETLGEVFDGYIPQAPYIDIAKDLTLSPTKVSNSRRLENLKNTKWFTSAYPKATFTNRKIDVASLAPYSIYDKLTNIKRPILIVHGLNDNNTSPQSSANLAIRSWEISSHTKKYINLLFEGEVGHFLDMQNSKDEDQGPFARRKREYIKHIERLFRFIDVIRWHKERYSVFTLSQEDTKGTKNLASNLPFLMGSYNTNPKIHSPFERFMMAVMKIVTGSGLPEEEQLLKAPDILSKIKNNDSAIARTGMPILLLAALLDLKSRELKNGFHEIDTPLYTIESYWYYGRHQWLKEAYEEIFKIPDSAASSAAAEDHVLERFSSWEKTCLKDPDKVDCQINPKDYLDCLGNPSNPKCGDRKITLFCSKMSERAIYPKLNGSDPTETLQQILMERLRSPAFKDYREIIRNGDDIFSTPILNGRLG